MYLVTKLFNGHVLGNFMTDDFFLLRSWKIPYIVRSIKIGDLDILSQVVYILYALYNLRITTLPKLESKVVIF